MLMLPRQPPEPPPQHLVLQPVAPAVGGFWFGINYPLNIEGTDVCGRWLKYRNRLKQAGGFDYYWNPDNNDWDMMWMGEKALPYLFTEGGHFKECHRWGKSDNHQKVLAIMARVMNHEFEHRKWQPAWGSTEVPAHLEDTFWDWTRVEEAAPGPNHPVFGHHQLTKVPGATRQPLAPRFASPVGAESSVVRKAAGYTMREAYEGRDVYIVGLPELFFFNLHTRTAEDVYNEWLEAEIIIGCKKSEEP